MNATPSRREKREAYFYFLAEHGNMSCRNAFLFKSEARSLIRHGFEVERHGANEKESLPSMVSWENPFKNGIPLIVSNYISGTIQTFPRAAIENWAQELYVIAARVNNQKVGNKITSN